MPASTSALEPNTNRLLKRAIAGCVQAFWGIGLFSLAINILMLALPLYMMQVYDRVIPTRSGATLVLLTLITVVLLGVLAGLEWVRSWIMVRLSTWFDAQLAGEILSASVSMALKRGRARTAQGLRDLSGLRSFLTGPGIFPLFDSPWVPLFLIVAWILHPWLAVLGTAGAVILFGCALANEMTTRRIIDEANRVQTLALNDADSTIRNSEVVDAMGMMGNVVRRWHKLNAEALGQQSSASDRAGLISAIAKFVRLVLQVLSLGIGGYLVTQQEITPGAMIASSIILARAFAPVEQSIGAWKGWVQARASYRAVQELLKMSPTRADAMVLPRPNGKLQVENVTQTPAGAKAPILSNINFSLEPGETMGLIGPSAAGKTSLARLLVGAWAPTSGNVRLDGADMSGWDPEERGRWVGYLPQDVELFSGTVRETTSPAWPMARTRP